MSGIHPFLTSIFNNVLLDSKKGLLGQGEKSEMVEDELQNSLSLRSGVVYSSAVVICTFHSNQVPFGQVYCQQNSIKEFKNELVGDGSIQLLKIPNEQIHFIQYKERDNSNGSSNSEQKYDMESFFRFFLACDNLILTTTEMDYDISMTRILLEIGKIENNSNKSVIIMHYLQNTDGSSNVSDINHVEQKDDIMEVDDKNGNINSFKLPSHYDDSGMGYYQSRNHPPNFYHIFVSSNDIKSIEIGFKVLKSLIEPSFHHIAFHDRIIETFPFKLKSNNQPLFNFINNNVAFLNQKQQQQQQQQQCISKISTGETTNIVNNNVNNNRYNNSNGSSNFQTMSNRIDLVKDTCIEKKELFLSFLSIRNPNRFSQGTLYYRIFINKLPQLTINDGETNLYVVIYPLHCFSLKTCKITKSNLIYNVELSLVQIRPPNTGTFSICFNLFHKDKLVHRLFTNPIIFILPPNTNNNNNHIISKISPSVRNKPYPLQKEKKVEEVKKDIVEDIIYNNNNSINNNSNNNNNINNNLILDEKGIDMNSLYEEKLTYLMKAIQFLQWERVIKILMTSGVNINCKNSINQNEFQMCCFFDAPMNVLKLMVDLKCNYLERDNHGFTGLHLATERKNMEVVKFILNELPELVYVPNYQGLFPLHFTVMVNNIDMVKIYIDFQIKVYKDALLFGEYDNDNRDDDFEMDNSIVNDIFLKKQCGSEKDFINSADNNGMTALHWASALGFIEICRLLLQFGGINTTDNNKESCIFKAVASNQLEVQKLLESYQGFNSSIINKYGNSIALLKH